MTFFVSPFNRPITVECDLRSVPLRCVDPSSTIAALSHWRENPGIHRSFRPSKAANKSGEIRTLLNAHPQVCTACAVHI
jgi:hypothetical protein